MAKDRPAAGRGVLYVLSAPSGAGKTTISGRLQREGLARVSVSHTTRRPRPTEEDGKAYFFVSREEFVRLRDAGVFLEWAEVYGNLYGTAGDWVDGQLAAGVNVLLELDCQGARQVKAKRPAAVLMFMRPSDETALRRRLILRGEDDAAAIDRRLSAAAAEMRQQNDFDYVIINDDLEHALSTTRAIMTKEQSDHGENDC